MGTGRLLSFAFRALVLVLLIPILWISVADLYNEALVSVAKFVLPDGLSLQALDNHIVIEYSSRAAPFTVDGFMLHYGLILLAVLILAAVGVGVLARVGWLVGMGAGVFLLHVVGVALLARGVAWAYGDTPSEAQDTFVFSMFAVFWGLLPAVIGGAWCFAYWLPRLNRPAPDLASTPGVSGAAEDPIGQPAHSPEAAVTASGEEEA